MNRILKMVTDIEKIGILEESNRFISEAIKIR